MQRYENQCTVSCLKFQVAMISFLYTLRIKNYTLHTPPFKRKFCYAALQPQELPKTNLSSRSSRFKEQTQTLAKYKGKNWVFINLFYGLSRGKWVPSMVLHCMRLISYQRTWHYFTFTSLPQEYSLWWSSSRAGIRKSVVAKYSKRFQATLGLHHVKIHVVKFSLTSNTDVCITMVLVEDNTLYHSSLSFQVNLTQVQGVLPKLSHKGWNLYFKFLR